LNSKINCAHQRADIDDEEHHRALRTTSALQVNNSAAAALMQVENSFPPPTYQPTGQNVDNTLAFLHESIDLGRGMGEFKGPEHGIHPVSDLRQTDSATLF
jgi:hypothetical protein